MKRLVIDIPEPGNPDWVTSHNFYDTVRAEIDSDSDKYCYCDSPPDWEMMDDIVKALLAIAERQKATKKEIAIAAFVKACNNPGATDCPPPGVT